MSWHGVELSGVGDRLGDRVDGIVRRQRVLRTDGDGAVSTGSAGRALFAAAAAEAGRDGEAERAIELLGAALSTTPTTLSLLDGVGGLAVAADVVQDLLDPSDRQALVPGFEHAVATATGVDGSYAWDLVSGLAGAVVAITVIGGDPADAARRIVASGREIDGCLVLEPAFAGRPGAQTGIAHGIAGVVAALARSRTALDVGTRMFADRLTATLLGLRRDDGGWPGTYAGGPATSAPLSWCTGEPGVATALLAAGVAAGQPGWTAAGAELAERAGGRAIAEVADTRDTWICHGTAGLLQTFLRLHHVTRSEVCADAARLLLDRLLASGTGGPAGFLEGEAGVGLVLLSVLADEPPVWDRLLVLS